MPKLFEYLGFIFFFYSNDHEPFHCHVKKSEKEVKIDFIIKNGKLESVSIRKYKGSKKILTPAEREDIRAFVEVYYSKIKLKWDDFRAGKTVKSEKINKL